MIRYQESLELLLADLTTLVGQRRKDFDFSDANRLVSGCKSDPGGQKQLDPDWNFPGGYEPEIEQLADAISATAKAADARRKW